MSECYKEGKEFVFNPDYAVGFVMRIERPIKYELL
jgi:hypothetical protein